MPNYNFETLSSYEFETLVRDLLQEELGILLESFKPGRDEGIDLRYASNKDGSLIVQCKHYVGSGTEKLIADLKKYESPKVQRLSPKRYIIATSVGLSPSNKDDISKIFPSCNSTADIYGRDDLNNLLARHPKIETNHYKLWLSSAHVLEALLKSAPINRTRLDLERIHSKMKYYVQNVSFIKAKEILDEQHYCIISGIPGIGKTTLAEALFIDHISRGFEPVRIYSSIDEGFEMFKQGMRQVFYFYDFLGTTTFDENSLERNEDKQLLTFLQSVHNSSGEKKLILTSRDYILKQARLSLESVRSTDLKPYLCTINLSSYTRLNRAEILYNHLYFSDLSEKHIADLLEDKRYLTIIDHPNYSPRVIEWMTQMKNRWPRDEEDFAIAFLETLDNPMDLWKHAFERNLSLPARYVLWVLVTLPDLVRIDDLERVFLPFQRYMAENYIHVINPTDFHDALEELEGTFIDIDFLAERVPIARFHNPSIRDFLENYLTAHDLVIRLLARSAQFFSQLQWLWGKYQIGFLRSKQPVQIKPHYRVHLLETHSDFVTSLVRTIHAESPFQDLTNGGRRPIRFAGQLLLLLEINQTLNDSRLSALIADSLPKLRTQAEQGKEVSFELMKLANRLKDYSHFSDIKYAFLASLNSLNDFERYLIFKSNHAGKLTSSDEAFVEKRLSDLHSGTTLSSIDDQDFDYDDDEYIGEPFGFEDDDWSEDVLDEESAEEQHKIDPNEKIVDLFSSLRRS